MTDYRIKGRSQVLRPSDRGQFVGYFDGGGSALTAPLTRDVLALFDCTIASWRLVTLDDSTASAVIDVLKSTYPGPPSTSMVGAGAKPTLAAASNAASEDLSAWTAVTVTSGDRLRFKLSSVSTATGLMLVLYFSR